MDFSATSRPRGESVLPMINVVFLLLIFFLLAAEIAPPEPFAVDPPPAATGGRPEGGVTLLVAADGRIAFGNAEGAAAIAAAAGADMRVRLRADRAAEGAVLAQTLAALAAAGVARVDLITVPQ